VRLYFMKGGHIAGVEADALQDLSDQQAINKARELFAARKDEFDGFKVWQGARMVIQEPPPDDKPPVSKPRCPGPYRARAGRTSQQDRPGKIGEVSRRTGQSLPKCRRARRELMPFIHPQ
jgi:hypothetical protein